MYAYSTAILAGLWGGNNYDDITLANQIRTKLFRYREGDWNIFITMYMLYIFSYSI